MTPSGIKPATFRFVAQHLNHCATAVPTSNRGTNVKISLKIKHLKNLPNLYIINSIYKISLIHYNSITNGRYENDGVMSVENYNVYISFMKIHSSVFQNELRKAANIGL